MESLHPLKPISDYCINDGSSTVFDPRKVKSSDIAAVCYKSFPRRSINPPFAGWWAVFWPKGSGGWFRIGYRKHVILLCIVAWRKADGRKLWQTMNGWTKDFRYGNPERLSAKLDASNPDCFPYYLRHGCSDLIEPGVRIARPTSVPFMATLIVPPWHKRRQQVLFRKALRFRNALAAALFMSQRFQTPTAAELRPAPKPTKRLFEEFVIWVEDCFVHRGKRTPSEFGLTVPPRVLAKARKALDLARSGRGRVVFRTNGVSARSLLACLLFERAGVPVTRRLRGRLTDKEFLAITGTAGQILRSNLLFEESKSGSSKRRDRNAKFVVSC